MEPISLIVTALAAGALAAAKPVATSAVKDAYAGLKRLIQDSYEAVTTSVEQLEQSPESEARRAVVNEDLGKTAAATDAELIQRAETLIERVKADDPEVAGTFGLHLKGFTAKEFTAKDIETHATSGPATGVDMEDTQIEGAATFEGIRTTSGAERPKPPGQ